MTAGEPIRPVPGAAAAPAGHRPQSAEVVALRPPRPPVLREFQPDALEIEDTPPRRITRLTLYAVAALIASAVGWAAVSEVDRVVVAQGRLVSTAPNLVVQPLETSLVRHIAVAVGDLVRAGETLATLDPTFPAADLAQLRDRLAVRAAQIARLEAEIEGRDRFAAPDASEDARLQAAAFAQRQAFRRARLSDFDARIAGVEAAMATSRRDQQGLALRLEVLRELEAMRAQLLASQTGSRVLMLEARNARLELDGRLDHLREAMAEQEQEVLRVRAERQAFIEEHRQAALDELIRLRGERDGIAQELDKAALRRRMVVLTAPADAVVLEVANRSAGSVVREAEPLFTLVPLDVPIEAELAVEARDIGRVALGHPVRVKLDAFPYQEHGVASGRLRTISEGAFARAEEQGGQPVFRARVALGETRLRGVPDGVRLIPGMTLSGEVQIGRRNVLAYFLNPFLRGLDESLREP